MLRRCVRTGETDAAHAEGADVRIDGDRARLFLPGDPQSVARFKDLLVRSLKIGLSLQPDRLEQNLILGLHLARGQVDRAPEQRLSGPERIGRSRGLRQPFRRFLGRTATLPEFADHGAECEKAGRDRETPRADEEAAKSTCLAFDVRKSAGRLTALDRQNLKDVRAHG